MTKLGKYELHEQLGKGGFGTVYRATDDIGREVAIKILKPGFADEIDVINRFKKEALAAGSLFHSHIATILDFGESDGRFYIVMRYIDGKPLNEIIQERGKLPWDDAVAIIQQVGEALEFAHKKGFVHRDIKPGNILISPTEGAILTDFGLVKALTASGMSTTGVMMGTPSYIAPEIWSGEEATPATDVYSLACVFYEILTGKVLFDGDSTPVIMKKHFDQSDFSDMYSNPEYKSAIVILRIALSRNIKDRYQTMDRFISNLLDIAEHQRKSEEKENIDYCINTNNQQNFNNFSNSDNQVKKSSSSSSDYSFQKGQNDNQRIKRKICEIMGLFVLFFLVGYLSFLVFGKTTEKESNQIEISNNQKTISAQSFAKTQEFKETSTQSFRSTQSVISTQFVAMNKTATAESISAEVSTIENKGKLVFGPDLGSLSHDGDEFVECIRSSQILYNFITEASFTNPFSTTRGSWDYGFIFGGNSGEYRLVLKSDGNWYLYLRQYDTSTKVKSGHINNINIDVFESNLIKIYSFDKKGYLFVNGNFISELDLSERTKGLQVEVCTGVISGDEIPGAITKYMDWRIWNLDEDQDNNQTITPLPKPEPTPTSVYLTATIKNFGTCDLIFYQNDDPAGTTISVQPGKFGYVKILRGYHKITVSGCRNGGEREQFEQDVDIRWNYVFQ